MNARTAAEHWALEEYVRELANLNLWRQEIADRHLNAPETDAADYPRLDRVIDQLAAVLLTRSASAMSPKA